MTTSRKPNVDYLRPAVNATLANWPTVEKFLRDYPNPVQQIVITRSGSSWNLVIFDLHNAE